MKVLLITYGSRGDVQPFVALASVLQQRGHHPVLVAPESSKDLAAEHSVEFRPLDEGYNLLMDHPALRKAYSKSYRGLLGKIKGTRDIQRVTRQIKGVMAEVLRGVAQAGREGGDVVVHSPTLPAQHIGEMLGVPVAVAILQPGWIATSQFPCPMIPTPRHLPRFLNRLTYLPVTATLRMHNSTVNRWRAVELGLARRNDIHDLQRGPRGVERLVLQAFSSLVTPIDPAWPETVWTTGFWYLPAASSWSPPADLARFLDSGPPPVYAGFGSIRPGWDNDQTSEVLVEAAELAGVRLLLATGWGGLAPVTTSGNVFTIGQAPHDWLFPRMAAVMHHAGGGTVAAALAAGKPQILCPFIADQPHWSRRLNAIGVAPPPLNPRNFTAAGVAQALAAATSDTQMRSRASELGREIRAESGLDTAVQALEAYVDRHR